jgi:phenylacetate-CoA ligase
MLATPELICEATQRNRVPEMVPRWLEEIPLYRERKAGQAEGNGSGPGVEFLVNLPLIRKEDIRRKFPLNFLKSESELDRMIDEGLLELEHTAGTSEQRTPLLLPLGWWAEQELRALKLNPYVEAVLDRNPEARRVTLISPVCSGDICYTGTPSRNERVLGNALFINLSRCPFLWSESELERMARETVEWNPVFLDLDPVYGVAFGRYCEQRGIRLPSLRFIICSYEFVSVVHRRLLERVFGVPVFNLYGSTETGHLMMENQMFNRVAGTRAEMQGSCETAYFEELNTDSQGVGDLVVTTLTNSIMPLIRYSIGDLVEREEAPFGTRYRVHGRAADAFRTTSGRRVTTWQVDQCFVGLEGFVHYQLAQGRENWKLRFVADEPAPSEGAKRELTWRLEMLLEARGQLTVEATDLLMPESSGKFKLGYPAAGAGSLSKP